ncbi:PA3715 family protein [Stenotrophomonas rhizophila]|uniref:Multidrug ABC transporter ATPase n=1 Tax=Stenotrophomonas rhizophila TaxID=216778 RepID=A0A498CJY0_9GAMM|nr:hypothetical protein [Stenotrophomonas rhizophila]RLK53180.1 hypothetical protein BCL79_2474 [Stenotrophomonas rhizophila]
MRIALSLLLAAACGAALPAHAQDCHDAQAAAEEAYVVRADDVLPDRPGYTRDTAASVCRRWPARPELTLVATPVWRDGDHDARDGDVEVLVIDSDTLATRAWTVLPGALDSDAIFFDGMQLDTARYLLAPDTLAFGLRVQRRNGSGPNPFSEEQLHLLAVQADTLRTLGPPMVLRRFQAEWDTRCAGESTDVTRTVAVGSKGQHGLADLILRERRVTTHSWMDGDTCRDQDTPVDGERRVLRFDGRRYAVPEALQPL